MNEITRWWATRRPLLPHATALPHSHWYAVIVATILLALGLWGALVVRPALVVTQLAAGRPSPATIQAADDVSYVSRILTEQRRADAEARPENIIYQTDRNLPLQQQVQLETLLRTVGNIRNDPSLNHVDKRERLVTLPASSLVISDTLAEAILSLDANAWASVERQSISLYGRALAEYRSQIDANALQELLEVRLPEWSSGLPQVQRDLVLTFVGAFLRINHVLNEEATALAKEEARTNVEPVVVTVQAGQNIVRVGEIITPQIMEMLEQTGSIPEPNTLQRMLGLGLLAAMLSTATVSYLSYSPIQLHRHPRQLFVVVGVILATVVAFRLMISGWNMVPYAIPFAAPVLAFLIVFDSRIAILATVILSVMAGLIYGEHQLAITIMVMLGSLAGILLARNRERLVPLLLAGCGIALAIFLSQIAHILIMNMPVQPLELAYIAGICLLNGVLAAVIAWGIAYLVASLAGIVTAPQLMELAHPSRPLLRKLMREAPGTYYHSVSVGNLAEAAAEAVGADALLLRVAAYYHDIGKTIRPYFFTDNQTGRENVHNDLDPQTSAGIIIDHVREGVKMARAAGLPQMIIDFIATHHGTHVVGHFYQMALRQEDVVNIEDFRYPGPIPFTREQGILMLADSVEATIRSKAQHGMLGAQHGEANGRQTLDEMVASIIEDRLRTGQLNDTPLTLHELILIREAFVATLRGIYHPRTQYAPQLVKV